MTTSNSMSVKATHLALPAWRDRPTGHPENDLCVSRILVGVQPVGTGCTSQLNQFYRQRRKNCAPPLLGTVTCHWLPTTVGVLGRVDPVGLVSLDLLCTENPAFASGQDRIMLPPLMPALSDAPDVLSVAFGPNKSEATISSIERRPW